MTIERYVFSSKNLSNEQRMPDAFEQMQAQLQLTHDEPTPYSLVSTQAFGWIYACVLDQKMLILFLIFSIQSWF